jgi:hypothetical protein
MKNQELEAILQRHAAGDRDLGLLAFLDAAAWECYHDPWEARPDATAPAAGSPRTVRVLDAIGDPQIRPRDLGPAGPLAEHLAAYLDSRSSSYTRDEAGGFNCTSSGLGLEDQDQDLALRLSVEGRRGERVCFYLCSSRTIPEAARGDASWFCDRWNHAGQCLEARLDMPRSCPGQPRAPKGALVLFRVIPVPPDAPMAALGARLDQCLAQAGDFWAMLQDEAKGWPE